MTDKIHSTSIINPKANIVDKDDLIVGEDQVTVSVNRQKSDDNIKNSGYIFFVLNSYNPALKDIIISKEHKIFEKLFEI